MTDEELDLKIFSASAAWPENGPGRSHILKFCMDLLREQRFQLLTEINAFQSALMAKYGRSGGVTITKEKFIEIWKDQEKYEDLPQILEALGFEK